MKPKARTKAREYALQALYEWLLSGNDVPDIETNFFNDHLSHNTDRSYFQTILHGVTSNLDAIDDRFIPFLDRPISKLQPIELCVLRLAVFELLYQPDVPFRVVINEALELAKKFGSTDGYKFVNGVLDQVARAVR